MCWCASIRPTPTLQKLVEDGGGDVPLESTSGGRMRLGRPPAFAPPSLDRAFMLGNELIAASEEFGEGKGWCTCVEKQFGMSYRAARRYIAFAQWANEHTEDFVRLLRMKPQPSFLIAPRIAELLFRSGLTRKN